MSITEQLYIHRLRWLEHVLLMADDLLRRAHVAKPNRSWKTPSGGQHMTWQRNMKSSTEGSSHVGNVRLASWKSRDRLHLWLETLGNLVNSRNQWRSCTFSLTLFVLETPELPI